MFRTPEKAMTMEQHATPFQLGNHEDAPETGMQEELQALKLEKLGNRVALLAVLIPCLVGVLLAIGYLDVRNRIKHAHASEAAGMEQLAADLDARMAAFTREQAQIKDAQAQKAADLETSIAAVQAGLEATASLLDQYAAAGISRQELSRELAALDEKNRAAADSLEI